MKSGAQQKIVIRRVFPMKRHHSRDESLKNAKLFTDCVTFWTKQFINISKCGKIFRRLVQPKKKMECTHQFSGILALYLLFLSALSFSPSHQRVKFLQYFTSTTANLRLYIKNTDRKSGLLEKKITSTADNTGSLLYPTLPSST